MTNQIVQKGDFLFYYINNIWMHPIASLIDLGEYIQKPGDKKYHYHCAIAIDENTKFEADGGEKVGIYPIDENELFEIVRPKVSEDKIDDAIEYIKTFEGQSYDWWADLNDAIRIISNNKINIDSIVSKYEKHAKVCYVVGELFAEREGLFSMSKEQIDIATPQLLYDKLMEVINHE